MECNVSGETDDADEERKVMERERWMRTGDGPGCRAVVVVDVAGELGLVLKQGQVSRRVWWCRL